MLAAPSGFTNPVPDHPYAVLWWALMVGGFIAIVAIAATIANHLDDHRNGRRTTRSDSESGAESHQ